MDIQSDSFLINLLKPTSWAPLVSIIGIILYMAGKKASKKDLGQILLGFGILQVGLSLKSHDPSQRANGMLTIGGGVVITFTKEILTLITG